MNLGGIVDGIGDAISGGVSSITMLPTQAINFAQGIASRAENFVEERVGPTGMAVIGAASNLVEGPMGLLPEALGVAMDAISDPAGFVAGIVNRARGMVTSAITFAENTVSGLITAGLAGIQAIVNLATSGIRALIQGAEAAASFAIRGVTTAFMFALTQARLGAVGLLKFGGKMAKSLVQAIAMERIARIQRLQAKIQGLTMKATAQALRVTTRAFGLVQQKIGTMVMRVHTKATRLVGVTMPRIAQVTARVMLATTRANRFVQSAVNRVRSIMPGGWVGPLDEVARFTSSVALRATQLHLLYVTRVMPAAMRAYMLLERTMWPLFFQAMALSTRLEASAVGQITATSALAMAQLADASLKLQNFVNELNRDVQGAIDTGIRDADARSLAGVQSIGNAVASAEGDALGGVSGVARKGESMLPGDSHTPTAHAGGKSGVGELLGIGGVGKRVGVVVDKARAIGNRIVDGAIGVVSGILEPITHVSQKKPAHDGELTGPFFPQSKDKTPGAGHFDAEARHAQYDEASRRSMLKRGARIFVNGIDTTLEDHYAAAQRLANEIGAPVVGIYNASGGKGSDLLQCASDKLFDRSDNPAIKTLVGVLDEQGHKPGKQPTQVYAHSQGSLIVSEALRQSGKGGANLQQFEVTTFGNAAYTFPKGPKYHHYVHDDDLVPSVAGTSSRMSYLMNQTRIGRWLSEKVLGEMSDAQKDTVVLHQGGAMIAPHNINARKDDGTSDQAEQKRDYIGHLKMFQSEEKRAASRGARSKAIETSVGFSMARGIGQMASDGIASGFGKMDTLVKTVMPRLPGNVGGSLWSGISNRLTSFGHSVYAGGARLGRAQDSYYFNRTQVQRSAALAGGSAMSAVLRSGSGPMPEHDPEKIKSDVEKSGDHGTAPDSILREKLSPQLGFDPSMAKLHTGPEAASAAEGLAAKAFAIGRDVYFGANQFDPRSAAGQALIAHELVHVGQQTGLMGHGVQRSPAVGAAADSMEAEAQTVATRVLENAGNPAGLHIEHFHKTYESEEGLGRDDARRLDQIAEIAVRRAEERLGSRTGLIDQVSVSIELDLGRLGDNEAAQIWADAIVAEVVHSAIRPLPSVPPPKPIQRDPKVDAPERSQVLPHDVQTALDEDAEKIKNEIKSWFPNRALIIALLTKWDEMDSDTAGRYKNPHKHLDWILTLLAGKAWDKGILATQYANVLDELIGEFKGSSGFNAHFAELIRKTKYATYEPKKGDESASSYVARHTLMGVLGIIKALSGALMGLGQAALWAEWKTSSYQRRAIAWSLEKFIGASAKDAIDFLRSDNPPRADEEIASRFDFCIRALIGCFDDLSDKEREAMFEDYSFGHKWGAIPANLMLLGAGGGGVTSKGAQALLKGLMVAQTVKGIDDAMVALGKRVQEIQEKNPNASWWDVLSDGEVLKQFTTIIVSAIALGTNMAEADQKAKGLLELLKKLQYAGDWTMLAPMFKKAWDDYHEAAANDTEKAARKDKLEQDAIDIINQIISVGNSTKDKLHERQLEQQRQQQEQQIQNAQRQQAEQERLGRAYESNKQAEAQAAAKAAAPTVPPSPVVPTAAEAPVLLPAPKAAAEPASTPEPPTPSAAETPTPESVGPAPEGTQPMFRKKTRGYPGSGAPGTTTEPNGHIVTRDQYGMPVKDVSPNGRVVTWERIASPDGDPAKVSYRKSYDVHRSEVGKAPVETPESESEAATGGTPPPEGGGPGDKGPGDKGPGGPDEPGTPGGPAGPSGPPRKPHAELVKELQDLRKQLQDAGKQLADKPEWRKEIEDQIQGKIKQKEAEVLSARAEEGVIAPKGLETFKTGTREEQVQAAKELIVQNGDWKGKLREFVAGMDKGAAAELSAALDNARTEILKSAWDSIVADHPEMAELKISAPGTPGFGSDIDVGVNPRESVGSAGKSVNKTMEQIARQVELSAKMVELMNERIRKMTGGESDKTLDTNFYSWAGTERIRDFIEGAEPVRGWSKEHLGEVRDTVKFSQDAASLTELRRNMKAGDWEATRNKLLADAERSGGKSAAQEVQRQLERSDQIFDDLSSRTQAERAPIEKTNPRKEGQSQAEWDTFIEMKAREKVAGSLRAELVAKMRAAPPKDFGRISELQAMIAMAEPGAYASQAGVDEVVSFGQQLVNLKDEAARRHFLESPRPSEARDSATSAASSLAQFEGHAQHMPDPAGDPAHLASSELEARELLKNSVKYSERILTEARKTFGEDAGPAGVEELDRFFRKGHKETIQREGIDASGQPLSDLPPSDLGALIFEYASQRGLNVPADYMSLKNPTPEQQRAFIEAVNAYTQEKLAWARGKVVQLKVRGVTDRVFDRNRPPDPNEDRKPQ